MLPTQTEKTKIIPLVTFYTFQSTQLNLAVKQNFSTFLKDTNFLQKHKSIAAYKRNKSLLDTLVQSRVEENNINTKTENLQILCSFEMSKEPYQQTDLSDQSDNLA